MNMASLDDEALDLDGTAPTWIACSSSESSHSPAAVPAANSITGQFSAIEQRYRIDGGRVLGVGRRATVRECADLATGRRYAVKSVRKSRSPAEQTTLRREVALLREADHPNVVRLVDVREDAGRLHIVTDAYAGGDLLGRIRRNEKASSGGASGRLDEGEARGVLRDVLRALSYLHGRDIVHRDVKPENVAFETPDARSPARLIDLGLARKHYRDDFEPYMSTVVGTPHFLAPEVLRRKYDRRCDLWSAGATAYLLLAGRLPFDGKNGGEVLDAVRKGKCRFPSEQWDGVSREAKHFVGGLLQTNPKRRTSVEGALEHPWMARDEGETSKSEECKRGGRSALDSSPKKPALSLGGVGRRRLRLSMFR